jgi:hypothetical protein
MGVGILTINVGILICYNVTMIFIYKSKNPFFEKYRINPVIYSLIYRNRGLGKKIINNGSYF